MRSFKGPCLSRAEARHLERHHGKHLSTASLCGPTTDPKITLQMSAWHQSPAFRLCPDRLIGSHRHTRLILLAAVSAPLAVCSSRPSHGEPGAGSLKRRGHRRWKASQHARFSKQSMRAFDHSASEEPEGHTSTVSPSKPPSTEETPATGSDVFKTGCNAVHHCLSRACRTRITRPAPPSKPSSRRRSLSRATYPSARRRRTQKLSWRAQSGRPPGWQLRRQDFLEPGSPRWTGRMVLSDLDRLGFR